MVEQKCHRCNHEWDYSGTKLDNNVDWPEYIQCPNCKTSVKLNKVILVKRVEKVNLTAREFMLIEALKELRSKKMISLNDLEGFIYQVDKLLMSYRDVSDSRDSWREKYKKEKKKNGTKNNK